jgi:hypothetical protein
MFWKEIRVKRIRDALAKVRKFVLPLFQLKWEEEQSGHCWRVNPRTER